MAYGLPKMVEETWDLYYRPAIGNRLALVAAKKGKGKKKKGRSIPQRVREFGLADDRGLVSQKDSDFIRDLLKPVSGKKNLFVVRNQKVVHRVQLKGVGEPPHLDWDYANYVGDENDGVYFDAIKKGKYWWAMATVDSDTGGFVDTLLADYYTNEAAAFIAAFDAAIEWCAFNDVNPNVSPSIQAEVDRMLRRQEGYMKKRTRR